MKYSAGWKPKRRLADDGKRQSDLDRARDVVYRLAPQDNSVGRGRSGGGMVQNGGAHLPPGG